MRSFLAGLFFLLLALPAAVPRSAFGQASGFVESMGFDRAYRPDAWVPMVVNLKSTLGEPAEYIIQVVQPDMDGDKVLYSRLVTLNANAANEKYWVYFRPQPSGLDSSSIADLQKQLQVRLCARDGKQLALLPLTTTLADIDPKTGFAIRRGQKMILAVVGGGSSPAWSEYDPQNIVGITEDVSFIKVSATDLPENAIGYDAVDAVVWFDADTADLTRGGSGRLAALQEWVREGGRLVVCQPDEAYRIKDFADILPIELKTPDGKWLVESVGRALPEPLHTLATEKPKSFSDPRQQPTDLWHLLAQKNAPFKVARANAKNDALVETWVTWDKDTEGGGRTPYIARNACGLGSVTWVAQDLGSPSVAARFSSGWPYVWDKVFGWKNDTILIKSDDPRNRDAIWSGVRDAWNPGTLADVGGTLLSGMDHTGKAGAYVFLVILFFIGYWIVAGPGSYLFLAGKGQRHLSWAIFAVAALGATLLTVLVVRLLLRGNPEVRHTSFVRLSPGQPAVVESRVGLYIPRDGTQTVSLRDAHPDSVSTVTALPIHPQHLGNYSGFPDTLDYEVRVRGVAGEAPVEVGVPYRSTLKKLQVHWVGNLPGGAGITGDPMLVEAGSVPDVNGDGRRDGYIGGKLTNKTGHDLRNIFIAFNYETASGSNNDLLLYVPSWKKDEDLDLLKTFASAEWMFQDSTFDKIVRGTAGIITGFLDKQWGPNLLKHMKTQVDSNGVVDDSAKSVQLSLCVLTLFDRIPPAKNEKIGGSFIRPELMRRGGRNLDMSQLVAAGNLVLVAEVDNAPLPFPMDVEGDRMTGEGRVYYQATLPLRNRTKLATPPPEEEPPATAPSQQPAAAPAPGPRAQPEVERPGT